jgi:hypothetical protein
MAKNSGITKLTVRLNIGETNKCNCVLLLETEIAKHHVLKLQFKCYVTVNMAKSLS